MDTEYLARLPAVNSLGVRITPDIERQLINAGVLSKTGYIVNCKVRKAFAKICDNNGLYDTDANAEAFLLLIWNQSKYRGESFNQTAKCLGY